MVTEVLVIYVQRSVCEVVEISGFQEVDQTQPFWKLPKAAPISFQSSEFSTITWCKSYLCFSSVVMIFTAIHVLKSDRMFSCWQTMLLEELQTTYCVKHILPKTSLQAQGPVRISL